MTVSNTPHPQYETLFKLKNILVLLGWAAAVLALFLPNLLWIGSLALLGICGIYIYVAFLARHLSVKGEAISARDFFTLAGVLRLLKTTRGAFASWTHILAFDLFVGLYISQHSEVHGLPWYLALPCLAAVLMFGPAGFVLYALISTVALGHLPI